MTSKQAEPPLARNLVTDLTPQFPYEEGGNPHIAAFRSGGFQYILQFEDGYLIGAVVFAEQYSDMLSGILADPGEETKPKLEVVTH